MSVLKNLNVFFILEFLTLIYIGVVIVIDGHFAYYWTRWGYLETTLFFFFLGSFLRAILIRFSGHKLHCPNCSVKLYPNKEVEPDV